MNLLIGLYGRARQIVTWELFHSEARKLLRSRDTRNRLFTNSNYDKKLIKTADNF